MKNHHKRNEDQDQKTIPAGVDMTQGLTIIQEQLTDSYTDGTVDRRIEQEER